MAVCFLCGTAQRAPTTCFVTQKSLRGLVIFETIKEVEAPSHEMLRLEEGMNEGRGCSRKALGWAQALGSKPCTGVVLFNSIDGVESVRLGKALQTLATSGVKLCPPAYAAMGWMTGWGTRAHPLYLLCIADLISPLLWSLVNSGLQWVPQSGSKTWRPTACGWRTQGGYSPVGMSVHRRPSRKGCGDVSAESGARWGERKPAWGSLASSQWLPGGMVSCPCEAGTWDRPHCPLTVEQRMWEYVLPMDAEHGEKLKVEVFRPRFFQGSAF